MLRALLLCLCLGLLITNLAAADDQQQDEIPLFGHNLTSTSDTLHAHQWILGEYAVGYGFDDHFMVIMSPWISLNYNMTSFGFKYGVSPGWLFDRVSIETYYFKTLPILFNMYRQESTFSRFTATKRFSNTYRLHTGFIFQYFWDDRAPFSLRPPPLGGSPVTLAASFLHEIHLSPEWGFFVETGVLGANYPNRYLQLGASGFYEKSWGYIQLGMSASVPIGSPELQGATPVGWTDPSGDLHENVFYERKIPIHPEVQIEFFL
jgi:hypothetical protein